MSPCLRTLVLYMRFVVATGTEVVREGSFRRPARTGVIILAIAVCSSGRQTVLNAAEWSDWQPACPVLARPARPPPGEADHDDLPIVRLAPPRIALMLSRRHGAEVGTIFPDSSQEDGEPARHRDARPLRPAPLHQLEPPALERRWPPDRGQEHVRGLV
jgi:hypothetical protein